MHGAMGGIEWHSVVGRWYTEGFQFISLIAIAYGKRRQSQRRFKVNLLLFGEDLRFRETDIRVRWPKREDGRGMRRLGE